MLTLSQTKNKSLSRLAGLHPVVLAAAEKLIECCYANGVPILITQGLRTVAEQNALYAQGRTKQGTIVTNARGGYSYHNYGLAIDFALLLPDGSSVSWDMKRDGDKDRIADWYEVVQLAKSIGFEWGGDFTSFKDYPHLQMSFGMTIPALRAGLKPAQAQITAAYKLIAKKEEEGIVKNEGTAIVKVNGVKISEGLVENGVTYAPVRIIAEALGAKVGYEAATKTVEITNVR